MIAAPSLPIEEMLDSTILDTQSTQLDPETQLVAGADEEALEIVVRTAGCAPTLGIPCRTEAITLC